MIEEARKLLEKYAGEENAAKLYKGHPLYDVMQLVIALNPVKDKYDNWTFADKDIEKAWVKLLGFSRRAVPMRLKERLAEACNDLLSVLTPERVGSNDVRPYDPNGSCHENMFPYAKCPTCGAVPGRK